MKVRLIVTLLATLAILVLVQATIEKEDDQIQESVFEEPEKSDPKEPEKSDRKELEEGDPKEPEEGDPQEPEEGDPQEPEEGDTQEEKDDEHPVKSKRIEDIPGLTEDLLTKTIHEARKEILQEEARTTRRSQQNEDQTSQTKHFMRGHKAELEPGRIDALIKELTIKKLAQKLGMSTKNTADALEGLESNSIKSVCKKTPPLSTIYYRKYRTVDGSRNRRHPNLGRANTPFRRLLKADYGDGISSPRTAKNGSPLPNARLVSKTLFDNKNNPSKQLAHMAMIWGQFLDHDITQSAESEVDCTGKCGLAGECFGISIPAGDNAFTGRNCIEVVRNVPFCHRRKHKREQINTLSSFIDASAVYSSNEKKFFSLRDPKDSALLIEMRNPSGGKNLLSPEKEGFCRSPKPKTRPCFLAGDARVNENSGLASMHTIWNREHNRIVTELRRLRPRLKQKRFRTKLFFEARKIIGAMVQHITYNEFLPAILSEKERSRFHLRLRLLADKPYTYFKRFRKRRYRPNPSIFNSFATAAYRFGHSLIQNQLNRFSKFGTKKSPIPMDQFFNTSFLYEKRNGGVDSILRGLARDRAQQVDGSFAKAIHEKLIRFEKDLADLPAINVQRGRDHGIPGYNSFRKLAGLKKAKNFDDLKDVMTAGQINNLKKVYKHVDDIDLYVGGVYEKPCDNDGAVGKTFSFIIARQFHNLRFGDRFWYENLGEFSPSQLKEIRKSSLARVICDNSDGIKWTYKKVIEKKKRIRCRHLPKVNLKKWT